MNKKKYITNIIITIIGLILGYIYWYKVGCNSGSCPITSRWYLTTIYGGLIGYLGGDLIYDIMYKRKKKSRS